MQIPVWITARWDFFSLIQKIHIAIEARNRLHIFTFWFSEQKENLPAMFLCVYRTSLLVLPEVESSLWEKRDQFPTFQHQTGIYRLNIISCICDWVNYLNIILLFEYCPSPEFVSLWISLLPPPKPKGWNSHEQAQTKKGAKTQLLKKNPDSLHLPLPMQWGFPKFCSFTKKPQTLGNSHLEKSDQTFKC